MSRPLPSQSLRLGDLDATRLGARSGRGASFCVALVAGVKAKVGGMGLDWHPTRGGWKISSGVGEANDGTWRLVHDCGKRRENGVFQNTSTAEWAKLWGASRQWLYSLCCLARRIAAHRIASQLPPTQSPLSGDGAHTAASLTAQHTPHCRLCTHERHRQKTELGRRTGGEIRALLWAYPFLDGLQ
ncbi:hypothetical protein BGZ61DRAFT_50060 [Ilyonectria robusta]|uniref:uncharacterized protein n=1 Tax=Ilyonectria robusta TaxID=1079257 RepID=UPI001E8E8448|nr:uncharacterized protein BGZ61DRAFT_50060 [Ilyonectria robusta]KAH8687051.1 hypothetical protein BGZ61DRAFT_50060 [Ilyonectria robusta]